jgi:hypothetical protein
MPKPLRSLAAAGLVAAVSLAPGLAAAVGEAKPGTASPSTTTPVAKAQRCMELKKRLADYQADPKKKASETIKKDIDWYQKNCK